MRKPFILLSCFLLAGCWQSTGSLLSDMKPVQTFHAGKVVYFAADKPTDRAHEVLSLWKDGIYVMSLPDGSDRKLFRFFALPGLPRDIFVVEHILPVKCRPENSCNLITSRAESDYALVRMTKTGAEVFNPDCAKGSEITKLPGVRAGDYGICTFSNRSSLEKALLALAKQSWKTSVIYKYE